MNGVSPLDGTQYLPCAVNTLSSPAVQDNTPHFTILHIWTNSHSLKIQQISHKYFLTSKAVITAKTTPLAK
jgi:hypothetical protein